MKVKSLAHSCLTLCDPMDCNQAPPSMGFSRQEYWSGLPFPSPGDLPDPGMELRSPAFQADALTSEPPGKWHDCFYYWAINANSDPRWSSPHIYHSRAAAERCLALSRPQMFSSFIHGPNRPRCSLMHYCPGSFRLAGCLLFLLGDFQWHSC